VINSDIVTRYYRVVTCRCNKIQF